MAKIVAEFDTVDKTLNVKVDGKAMKDVCEIFMGQMYSMNEEDAAKFMCSVMSKSEDEESDSITYTRLSASKIENCPESKDYPGLFHDDSEISKAHLDIAKYFQ